MDKLTQLRSWSEEGKISLMFKNASLIFNPNLLLKALAVPGFPFSWFLICSQSQEE